LAIYDWLTTTELIEELEVVMRQAESLVSQLEKLRSIGSIGRDSLAYNDVAEHLGKQIGQLSEEAISLRDVGKRRIATLYPKASLIRHRLEYLDARRAIGTVSEEIYIEARNELIDKAGEDEDSMMRLMRLIELIDKVMLKIPSLLNLPKKQHDISLQENRESNSYTANQISSPNL
jgi:hypothetical protein